MIGQYMKKRILLLIQVIVMTLVSSCDQSTSGPDTPDGTALGLNGEDYGQSIMQTRDGGYFITGYTKSIRNNHDIYVIKTDRDFTAQWSKTYGNNNIDRGYAGKELRDGGFIIVGTISAISPGNTDIYVAKTDSRGKMLWSNIIGGINEEEGRAVEELPDGDIVIAGTTASYGAGSNDILLVKMDALGNQKWIKTYGSSANDLAFDIKKTSDGGLIVTGFTSGVGPDYTDTFLLKTDADGNQQWFERFDADGRNDEAQCVIETTGGGFVAVGRYNNDLASGGYQAYVVKSTADGSTVWKSFIGFSTSDEAYSVVQARDGNYILTGKTFLNKTLNDYQLLLVKIDNSGNILWTKTYGGSMDEVGYDIQQADNGYVVAGYTASYGHGSTDIYVLNIDEDGEVQ